MFYSVLFSVWNAIIFSVSFLCIVLINFSSSINIFNVSYSKIDQKAQGFVILLSISPA
jgi:hypothetical protein